MQGDRTHSDMIETSKTQRYASRGLFAKWRDLSAWRGLRMAASAALVCGLLAACTGEQFQKGYILPQGALEQIGRASCRERV